MVFFSGIHFSDKHRVLLPQAAKKKHCNHWQSLVFPLSPAKTFFSPRMQYSPHLSIIHSHLEKNVQIATAITFHMHTLFINSVHALWILCKYPQNTKSQKWDIDELNIILKILLANTSRHIFYLEFVMTVDDKFIFQIFFLDFQIHCRRNIGRSRKIFIVLTHSINVDSMSGKVIWFSATFIAGWCYFEQ